MKKIQEVSWENEWVDERVDESVDERVSEWVGERVKRWEEIRRNQKNKKAQFEPFTITIVRIYSTGNIGILPNTLVKDLNGFELVKGRRYPFREEPSVSSEPVD